MSEFSNAQLSEMFDLSNIEPGSTHYMRICVARYIALGGEFPEDYIIEYMRTSWVYPLMPGGKRGFPGVGITHHTEEQAARHDELKLRVKDRLDELERLDRGRIPSFMGSSIVYRR